MPIAEFSLGDFLKCFVEYAVKERRVKSFAPPSPQARPWNEFLCVIRHRLLHENLPYAYFGAFEFSGAFPKSLELQKVIPELEEMCYVRLPDYRLMLYPDFLRISFLPNIRDPILERTMGIAYNVAIYVPDFLEV